MVSIALLLGRRAIRAVGFLALLTATAASCWAQAPRVADPRVVIDRLDPNYRQFNAVGMVYPIAKTDGLVVMSKYRGTGAMISPCHLLTNYHVAFEATRKEVMFEVGQPAKDIAAFAFRGVGRILDAGPFWADADTVDDWALVKLIDPQTGRSNNLGDRVGYFQFVAAAPEAIVSRPLISAGYPGSMALGLMGHVGCRLARVDPDRRWRMACAMTEGQSGGPVTLRTADRGDILIAINSAKPDGRSGIVAADEVRLSNLNYATAITRAAETRIRRGMDANRCD
jgi:V8-like Glu-specific endopeptidase